MTQQEHSGSDPIAFESKWMYIQGIVDVSINT